ARQPGIFAVLAPAAHDVGPCLDPADHLRQITRIVLKVTVGRRDQAPSGVLDAGRKRRRLSEIPPEPDNAPPWVALLVPAEALEAVVGAAIIDDEHLVAPPPPLERVRDVAVQLVDVRRLVPNRNDNR